MIFFAGLLLSVSIGSPIPQSSVGSLSQEVVHITQEMMVGIADELIKADIAEVDIDPTVFDIPTVKTRKKNELDEIEFVTESEKPTIKKLY